MSKKVDLEFIKQRQHERYVRDAQAATKEFFNLKFGMQKKISGIFERTYRVVVPKEDDMSQKDWGYKFLEAVAKKSLFQELRFWIEREELNKNG